MKRKSTPLVVMMIALVVFVIAVVGVSFPVAPALANDDGTNSGQFFEGRDGAHGDAKDSKTGGGGGGGPAESDPDWWQNVRGVQVSARDPRTPYLHVFGQGYGGFLNWLFAQFFSSVFFSAGR